MQLFIMVSGLLAKDNISILKEFSNIIYKRSKQLLVHLY